MGGGGYNIKSKILSSFCIFSGYNIRVLEITIDNCYKCDLETINDPNNSQNVWIDRKDFEIETKSNWKVIFDK